MRDAAAGEARGHSFGEQRQVGQRQESAITLAKRHPRRAAELGAAQMFEVPHDRIREEPLEVIRLRTRSPGGEPRHGMRVDARRAARAALIRQHHTEMLDRLRNPSVARRVQQPGSGPSRTTLQEHQQRQIVMHVLGGGHHAVEQADRFPVKAAPRLMTGPIKRHLGRPILDMQPRHVIFGKQRHTFPFIDAPRHPTMPYHSQFHCSRPAAETRWDSHQRNAPRPTRRIAMNHPADRCGSGHRTRYAEPYGNHGTNHHVEQEACAARRCPVCGDHLHLFHAHGRYQ